MVWGLKCRLDEIGLLSTPNMYCGLVKGKVILHQALWSGGCGWFSFVWFDSLRLINNLSVIKWLVFLGWTSTKLGLMFLLKKPTQWRRWGSNPRSRVNHSTTEPLRSHPRVCGWCLLNSLKFLISLTSYVLGTQESSRWNWPFEYPQHVLWFGKRKSDFASSTLILWLWLILFCLIWFFTSHQQSFSYKGTGLPGLNQY